MDPEELQSSEENERARRAREIAQAGLTAYRQGMSMPDEVPYMLAAPQTPAEPVEIFTNDVWPPVAPPAQQQVPNTPSEIVRGMDIPRVQPRRAAPAAPAGPQAATGAPVPAGVVNLGPQPVGQAPAPEQQGVGVVPPDTFVSPQLPVAFNELDLARELALRRGVSTGVPTVQRSVQTLTTPGAVSPETAQALEASDQDIRAALKFRADQQAEGLGQQGAVFEGADVASQIEAERQQRAAEDQAREMRWQTQRADNINQQVLAGQIDPNRVLGDSFSGGRIAAALGLFVAGMAQGQEGANAFLQNINQVIDRDIAAQMANLDNLRAGAQNQQNLVGMYRTVFGDEAAAREAARATMLQSVAQKLQAQQARMGQAGQQPALMMALAQLNQAQASAAAAAQQARSSTVSTRTQTQRSGGVSGGRDLAAARVLTNIAQAREQAGARAITGVREGMQTVGQLRQQTNPTADPELVLSYGDKRTANLGAEQAIRRIRSIIARNREDVPGAGMIDRLRPNFLQSFDGRQMSSELGNLKALYLKGTTGAVANQIEQENAENLTRGVTEEDLFDRIDRMEQLVMEQRRVQDASFPPDVVRTFQARMGPPPPQPLPVQGRQQR